jgi:hypothetical protein
MELYTCEMIGKIVGHRKLVPEFLAAQQEPIMVSIKERVPRFSLSNAVRGNRNNFQVGSLLNCGGIS